MGTEKDNSIKQRHPSDSSEQQQAHKRQYREDGRWLIGNGKWMMEKQFNAKKRKII